MINALLGFFFSASAPIVALVVPALWLSRRPASAGARRFVIAAAACSLVASLPIVPYSVSRLLTFGYHQFRAGDVPSGATAIVVLGGGDEIVQGWTDSLTITTQIEGARVLEAARVFRLISPAWIISSGGKPDISGPGESSGTTMRDELVRLGVPRGRIVVEAMSRSTRDNVAFAMPILKSLGIENVVVVTSDTHMRRALGVFRAMGASAIPAVAPDPRLPIQWFWWVLPTAGGLESSREVAREVGGIPYYWLRGWWR